MSVKKQSRLRRARRARAKIHELGITRLCIHRTPRHIYAQVIAADGGLRAAKTGNADAAKAVGNLVAERAKAAGITQVAYYRSGYKNNGRVKSQSDSAREAGLEF
ncbi:MAG: 50S ribosomal protein L18 [Exilibacterium sp.]